jgi:hypothetical protein
LKPRSVALLCLLCAAAAFFTAFFGPRLIGRPAKPPFAVVDLTSVIRKQQERAMRLLADPASDEAAKKAAIAAAGEFGKRANAEVIALSQECGCVVLMREAVVSGQIEDLTPRLLARLNVQ